MNSATKPIKEPLIYSYFELVLNDEPYVNEKAYSTWQFKSEWCKKKVIINGGTNSNLNSNSFDFSTYIQNAKLSTVLF